jgi:hypothetical protein
VRASALAFRGVVATVVDGNPFGLASDLRATVDWGDGHRSPAAFATAGRAYSLRGHHRYATPGRYNVVVRIRDAGGSRAVARSTMVVVAGR